MGPTRARGRLRPGGCRRLAATRLAAGPSALLARAALPEPQIEEPGSGLERVKQDMDPGYLDMEGTTLDPSPTSSLAPV